MCVVPAEHHRNRAGGSHVKGPRGKLTTLSTNQGGSELTIEIEVGDDVEFKTEALFSPIRKAPAVYNAAADLRLRTSSPHDMTASRTYAALAFYFEKSRINKWPQKTSNVTQHNSARSAILRDSRSCGSSSKATRREPPRVRSSRTLICLHRR